MFLTSFCNLSKRQACASLQIDVLRVYKGAESIERFAREEVGLGTLDKVRLAVDERRVDRWCRLTFSRWFNRSATASRSLSARTFS